MAMYENITIEKGMYGVRGKSMTQVLEQLEKFYDSLETMGVEIVEDDFDDIPLEDIELSLIHICSGQCTRLPHDSEGKKRGR